MPDGNDDGKSQESTTGGFFDAAKRRPSIALFLLAVPVVAGTMTVANYFHDQQDKAKDERHQLALENQKKEYQEVLRLAKTTPEDSKNGTLELLLKSDDVNDKVAALRIVGANRPDDLAYVPFLVAALNNADEMVRAVAAQALGRMNENSGLAAEALSAKVADSSERVRMAVLDGLAHSPGSSAAMFEVAKRVFNDEHQSVQVRAYGMHAMSQIDFSRTLAEFHRALDADDATFLAGVIGFADAAGGQNVTEKISKRYLRLEGRLLQFASFGGDANLLVPRQKFFVAMSVHQLAAAFGNADTLRRLEQTAASATDSTLALYTDAARNELKVRLSSAARPTQPQ